MSIIHAQSAVVAAVSQLLDPGTLNFSDSTVTPTTSRSGVRIGADGDVDEINQGPTYTDRGNWKLPQADAADYEASAVFISGVRDGGNTTAPNWHSCDGNPEWYIETETVEVDTAEVRISIRHKVNTSDNVVFTVNLSAFEDSTP